MGKACGKAQGSSPSTLSNQSLHTSGVTRLQKREPRSVASPGLPPPRAAHCPVPGPDTGATLARGHCAQRGPPAPRHCLRLPLTSRGCSVHCPLLEKQASARTVPQEAGLRFFPLPTGSPKPGSVCSLRPPASLGMVPARAWQSPGDASKRRRESAAEPTGWRRAGRWCGRWGSWRLWVPACALGRGVT